MCASQLFNREDCYTYHIKTLAMNTSLQRKIMRRIYYVYALRTLMQPALIQGFFMLALLIVLTYFVSIGNVIHNMLTIPESDLSTFLYNAIVNTEAWTLLILGVLIFSTFSLRFTLAPLKQKLSFAKV